VTVTVLTWGVEAEWLAVAIGWLPDVLWRRRDDWAPPLEMGRFSDVLWRGRDDWAPPLELVAAGSVWFAG
jgi:hypothetical protein